MGYMGGTMKQASGPRVLTNSAQQRLPHRVDSAFALSLETTIALANRNSLP